MLSGAPYGYRYVGKQDGGGQARYDILVEEARVVRQIFAWIGRDRLSIGEVCRLLQTAGERTRTGRTTWDRSVVWAILRNPAYQGEAAFGKTRQGPPQPRLRAQRHQPLQPRRARSVHEVPRAEWLHIPVPALVSADVFATVQEQLAENRQRARQGQRGARFLLQGLVCCARCRYAYYGKGVRTLTHTPQPRPYAYYRCIGTDAYRFGGQRLCDNLQVRTDQLDAAVWEQVRALLLHPDRLTVEYQRRLAQPPDDAHAQDLASLQTQSRKLRAGIGRLIDAYTEGLIDKADFEPRLARLKERMTRLDEQTRTLLDEAAQQQELLLLIGQLETFAATIRDRLDQVDWETQRTLIRTLVKRVAIDVDQVTVVFRVHPGALPLPRDDPSLQHCWWRHDPTLWRAFIGFMKDVLVDISRLEPLPKPAHHRNPRYLHQAEH